MQTEFTGGCHCGAVRFKVELHERIAYACNCSICHQKGFLHLIVARKQFTMQSGESQLSTYTFNTHAAKHLFCKICGVQSFYTPRSHPDGVSVNLRCLDAVRIEDFDIQPFDGQNWETSAQRQGW